MLNFGERSDSMNNNDAFSAGVIPGGLNNKNEIRILICYILNKFNIPMKKSDIILVLQANGLANYFDISEAFSELISNELIVKSSENFDEFLITNQGQIIAHELEKSLPKSVREKAVNVVESYLERMRNEKENSVIITQNNYGFLVTCNIKDRDFKMMKLELYAPDIESANNIKFKFYKDPSEIYGKILGIFADIICD